MKYPMIALCCLGLLQGCNLESNTNSPEKSLSFNYDFETGNQGWTAGFSDYPSDYDDLSIYKLASGIKSLPDDQSKHAFYIAGHNRSDDLFMYLKTKVSGLQASTRYIANIKIDMLSREGDNCFGIGGAPGSSVYVKFGVADYEGFTELYYNNLTFAMTLAP